MNACGGAKSKLPRTEMEPTRVVHPRKNILAQFEAVCYKGVATYFAEWNKPRTIRLLCPLADSRRAASIRTVAESAAGANRRVSRGASLGEATSAGAVNSQRTLHAAPRPTMTAIAFIARAETVYPAFAFAPSESSVGLRK